MFAGILTDLHGEVISMLSQGSTNLGSWYAVHSAVQPLFQAGGKIGTWENLRNVNCGNLDIILAVDSRPVGQVSTGSVQLHCIHILSSCLQHLLIRMYIDQILLGLTNSANFYSTFQSFVLSQCKFIQYQRERARESIMQGRKRVKQLKVQSRGGGGDQRGI